MRPEWSLESFPCLLRDHRYLKDDVFPVAGCEGLQNRQHSRLALILGTQTLRDPWLPAASASAPMPGSLPLPHTSPEGSWSQPSPRIRLQPLSLRRGGSTPHFWPFLTWLQVLLCTPVPPKYTFWNNPCLCVFVYAVCSETSCLIALLKSSSFCKIQFKHNI